MTKDLLTDEHEFKIFKTPIYKARIWISDNVRFESENRFNWFHRFMAKILLGWKIENL